MRALIILLWLYIVMRHETAPDTLLTAAAALTLSWRFSRLFTVVVTLSAALMHWYNWFYIPSAIFFMTLFVTIFMMPGGNSKAHRHDDPWIFYNIGGF